MHPASDQAGVRGAIAGLGPLAVANEATAGLEPLAVTGDPGPLEASAVDAGLGPRVVNAVPDRHGRQVPVVKVVKVVKLCRQPTG